VNRLKSFGLRLWQQLSGASDDMINRRNNDGDGYRSLQRIGKTQLWSVWTWEFWLEPRAGCRNTYEGAGYGTDVNHDIDGTVRKSPTVARISDCEFYSKTWDVRCIRHTLCIVIPGGSKLSTRRLDSGQIWHCYHQTPTATPLTFKPQLGPTSFQLHMTNFDVQTNILLVRVAIIW